MMNRIYIFFSFAIMFSLLSCFKSEDKTDVGPKAQMAVVQVSFNTPAVDLFADNNKITPVPLAFGTASGGPGNIYLPVQAGIRQLKLMNGSNTLLDKNQALDGTKFYSMFIFDTLRNNVANVGIIQDDTTAIDTLGRARFFHFIPGNDTLSALLVRRDTTILGTNVTYISTISPAFPTTIRPGNYKLQLFKNGAIIYSSPDSVNITARSLYTFIAKGTSGGTGINLPSVMILQNR